MRARTLAAGLAAVAAAAVATAAPASPAALRPCPTAGLVVWLDTQGSGAAGSVYYRLELTNLSGRACTLRGFPGVSAVGLGGQQLGSAASRDRARPVRLVVLARGASATAVLRIVQTANYPRRVCRARTAAGLRVYPPGRTASKTVPFPFRACSRRGPRYLSVQPVRQA